MFENFSVKKFVIIVIILSLLMISGSYLYISKSPIKTSTPPASSKENANKLPVDITDPAIVDARLNYQFEGKITSISKNQSAKTLTLTIQPTSSNSKVQTIEVRSDDEAFTLDPLQAKNATEAAQIKRIKVSELTVGMNIRVFTNYSFKSNKVTSGQIVVLPEK